MKTHFFLAALSALILGIAPVAHAEKKAYTPPAQMTLPEGVNSEMAKDAGNEAIQKLLTEFLGQADLKLKTFAVLPLATDVDGTYFTDRVRDQFTLIGKSSGRELYTRMDSEWENILAEIGWGQKFNDTMDPASVQKFGRIQGVQGLITGRLVSVQRDGDDVKVRFGLRAFEVETGRVLWGNETVATAKSGQFISANTVKTAKANWWIVLLGLLGVVILVKVLGAIGRAARPR